MKKIILILLLIPILSFTQSSESYKEFNFGVITDMVFDGDQIWPGASFLWGKTIYFNNNTVLDYQAGLAYLQLSKNQRFNFSAEYVLDDDYFGQSVIFTYGLRF